MSRNRPSRPWAAVTAVLAVLASLLVTFVAAAAPAQAAHLRAGGLNWHTTSTPGQVEFHFTGAYRWTQLGSPAVGSTVRPFGFAFGDGTSSSPNSTVVSVDAANDVFVVDAHFSKTYANTTQSYTAFSATCCRSSLNPTKHQNNPDGNFRVETLVNPAQSKGSAVSQTSPIVDCPVNALCTFGLPATSPDPGATLKYRFSTSPEAGAPFQQPSGATINGTTGVYSWNTTGAVQNGLYSTQVMIETWRNGTAVTKSAIDFFIRISSLASVNKAPAFSGTTPDDGSVLTGSIGQALTIPVQATDPNSTDVVTLGAILPAGATFSKTAGNPASGTITYTPTGVSDTLITLTASDQLGLQATQRSVRVTVSDSVPPVLTGPGNRTVEATGSAGAVATFSATAHDAVDGSRPVTCTPASGSIFPLGTTPVQCSAADAAGNTGTSTGSLTVADTTAPLVTLRDGTAEAVNASGATVTYTSAATDLVDGATPVSCAPASGTTFGLGATPVRCASTDAAGNTASTDFEVVVRDTTSPVLIVPGDVVAEATGPAGAAVTWSASGSDTVSGALVPTCTPASGTTFALGDPKPVSCSVTDGAGNATTRGFSVTVADTTAPDVTYTGPATLEAVDADGAPVVLSGTATDAVDGSPATVCTSADGPVLPLGVHEIVCTATDAAGNTGTLRASVTVEDTTGPTLTVPVDAVLEAIGADGAAHTFTATGTDTVSAAVVACDAKSGQTFPLGTTKVECTSTDSAGNATTDSFTVSVRDTSGPVITTSAGQRLEATGPDGATAGYDADAVDLVDGPVQVTCTPASGSTFPLGTTVATCTAKDSRGNGGVPATTSVEVVDTTAPTLTLPADAVVEAAGPRGAVVAYTASASDLADAEPDLTCSRASGETFSLGGTDVSCTATDASGNTSRSSFTITVQDTTAPLVSAPAAATAEATGPDGAAVVLGRASASDLVDGSLGATCAPSSGEVFPVGSTSVVCSATDAAGNVGTSSTSVTVTDKTSPVVTAPQDLTLEATSAEGAVGRWSAVTAQDLVDGPIPATCAPGSGSTFPIATTTVTCSAQDVAGNEAADEFTVTVQDTTAPAISVPSPATVEATSPSGAVVSFASATGTDAVDGTVQVSCNADAGDTFAVGSTPVVCTSADAAGNTASTSFVVRVSDTTAPVLSLPEALVAEATGPNGAGVAFSATAADLVDGTVPVICSATGGSVFGLGTTTVTCSAADTRGNRRNGTFTVTVRDTIVPTVTWSGSAGTYDVDQAVLITCASSDSGSGIASDTCAPVSTTAAALGVGTHTRQAGATDKAGNKGSGSVTFTVRATSDALCALTRRWVTRAGVSHSLCAKVAQAQSLASKGDSGGAAADLLNYRNQLDAQAGRSLTAQQAATLKLFSTQLTQA